MKLFIMLMCLSSISFAAQSLSTKIRTPYSSMRALGMGDAFVAVADDYSLMFYNPAGFARKPFNEFQISLAGAGVTTKTQPFIKDLKDASDTPGTDSQKAQAISDVLDKYYGQNMGGKVQALEIFWVRKNWGIGLLPVDLTVDMTPNRQVGPALDLNVVGDTVAAIGYGTGLSKEVDAGITVKYVHRVSVQQTVTALELANDSNVLSEDRFKEGTTFDFDLGFMWTPSWFGTKIVKKVETKKTLAPRTSKMEEPVNTEVPAAPKVENKVKEAPAETVAPKTEEAKPEGVKSEEIKPVDGVTAPPPTEETRAPQAEGDATEVAPPPATEAAATPPVEGAPAAAAAATEKKDEVPATAAPTAQTPPIDDKRDKAKDMVVEKVEAPIVPDQPVDIQESETEVVETIDEVYPLSFGLVAHNVLASSFSLSKQVNKKATEAPEHLDRVFDIGLQYKIINWEDFKIRFVLDARNLGHPEITEQKAMHAGVEFDYSPSGYFKTQLRAGLNQNYFTAGATLLLGILNIDVVTYGEEVGTPSNKMESRVNAAKVSFNF